MMRKKLQLVATLSLLAVSVNSYSQRYLTEIFTSVTKTSDVTYGTNVTVITGSPAASTLKMDVYEPTGDVLTERPLVLVLHTGSFLPGVMNGQPTGGKLDSAVVEICKQFAKRGYVAVAPDYRLGWNAISTDQDVRTGTLLNAVYRAIQDAKNCVRYFKEDRATTNTYKIDTTKICVGGLGSGGYVSLAYASLNKVPEIQLNKFINFQTSQPYVDQSLSGNFDGTNTTGSLNIGNYPNRTSSINMVFNVGGAIGDSSWIEAGEVPIVGFHCTNDPNAPYKTGSVIVPSTGDFVVEASGSYDVIRIVNQGNDSLIDNNAIFNATTYSDVYSAHADLFNDGYEGLYPFLTPAPGAAFSCTGANANPQTEQGAPWDWWDEAAYAAAPGHPNGAPGSVMACLAKTGNPDMSVTKGNLYIDTIMGYVNPRMVTALNLDITTGVKENAVSELSISPNPSTSDISFSVKGSNSIIGIELYDVTGRMVKQIVGLSTSKLTIQREGLSKGLYITKIQLNNGSISKKIILE